MMKLSLVLSVVMLVGIVLGDPEPIHKKIKGVPSYAPHPAVYQPQYRPQPIVYKPKPKLFKGFFKLNKGKKGKGAPIYSPQPVYPPQPVYRPQPTYQSTYG